MEPMPDTLRTRWRPCRRVLNREGPCHATSGNTAANPKDALKKATSNGWTWPSAMRTASVMSANSAMAEMPNAAARQCPVVESNVSRGHLRKRHRTDHPCRRDPAMCHAHRLAQRPKRRALPIPLQASRAEASLALAWSQPIGCDGRMVQWTSSGAREWFCPLRVGGVSCWPAMHHLSHGPTHVQRGRITCLRGASSDAERSCPRRPGADLPARPAIAT